MNKYIIKLEVVAEIEAFDSDDARDYVADIFGIDDEIKSIKITSIKEN
jgi:ribulose bisphosphate carboxylase small subunit